MASYSIGISNEWFRKRTKHNHREHGKGAFGNQNNLVNTREITQSHIINRSAFTEKCATIWRRFGGKNGRNLQAIYNTHAFIE